MPELQTSNNEAADTNEALNTYKRRTEFVPDTDRSSSELPAEVLGMIFDELASISPPYECRLDVILGPHSPFMDHVRFQKGLTLVCKRWWEPATQALYSRVVIRHMSQISALARTLSATDTGYDFSPCVKHVTLHECAILKPFSDVVLEHLRLVLRRCTALQSFSMVPHFNYSGGLWQWLDSALDVSWMAPGSLRGILLSGPAANIRSLDLPLATNSRLAIVELYHILCQTTRLQSLKLMPLYLWTTENESHVELSTLQTLSLPTLHELQFCTQCRVFTEWATSSLQLPNLSSLTLIDYGGTIPIPFLAANGGRVTYLHCYPPEKSPDRWYINDFDTGFRQLAAVAPMIKHLIVCATFVYDILRCLNEAEKPLLHLRHLDVWMHLSDLTRQQVMEESFTHFDEVTGADREKFPALGENVRFLSYHGHSDLPKICHPSALSTDDEIRTWCIRDVCVVQTSWCVRANEDFWDLEEGFDWSTPVPDEEDDPDFVAEDDEEDRTSWMSEDASDSGTEIDGDEVGHVTLGEGEVLVEKVASGLYRPPFHALLEEY